MRIAVGGIMHESNTFVSLPTDLPAFHAHHHGAEIFGRWGDSHHEMAGYLEGAGRSGFEAVPTMMASATPAGPITHDAFETLTGELIAAIRAAGRLDGMLLACHGAAVSEEY